jgi:hypothetical protein
MLPFAIDRCGRILVLFLIVLTGCAEPMLAAGCDQLRVSFQDGQLTISSAGCSLRQVLTLVGRQAGIETEVPLSASAIPVFFTLGPGNVRQVLSALLDGIPFNWSLAIKENGSANVERVMLTELITPREVPKPAEAAALTAPTSAKGDGKVVPGQSAPSNRGGEAKPDGITTDASVGSSQSDQPPRRADVDDSTLSKLPALPPGVPSAMWSLYPGIVDNGGAVQSGPPVLPSGQLASTNILASPSGPNPNTVPMGCYSCPVPPGINPAIVTLYPQNLMQLIQMPVTLPNISVPPMAPPIP